jgi:hypothetical protein
MTLPFYNIIIKLKYFIKLTGRLQFGKVFIMDRWWEQLGSDWREIDTQKDWTGEIFYWLKIFHK